MPKKKRGNKVSFDFNIGFPRIAISVKDGFKNIIDEKGKTTGNIIIKELTKGEREFQEYIKKQTKARIKIARLEKILPTEKLVCVCILQYCVSQNVYKTLDVDNIARSILNGLKGIIFKDDAQVKVLLSEKRLNDKNIDANFLFVGIKLEKKDTFSSFAKQANIEQQAIILFKMAKGDSQ